MHQNQLLALRINIFSKLISSGAHAQRRPDKMSEYPVSKKFKMQDGKTIYKTDKRWSAVLFMETFGRKQVAVYIWSKKGDEWKIWQKSVISIEARALEKPAE
jgi:hypothetical protein